MGSCHRCSLMQLAIGEIICGIEITGINGPRCGRDFAPFYQPLRGRCCRAVCCIQAWISPAGLLFFFSHLFNNLFFVHLTTQSHVHHFTQVAVIVEVLEKPLRLHPPGEAAKGPLCLGTSFVPNAARQIYLFKIRPLSTAAAAA